MSLVGEWVTAILKRHQLIKVLMYKVRNQITCKMNTAGSIMDCNVRNIPTAYTPMEMAVQLQRAPLVINKDIVLLECIEEPGSVQLRGAVASSQVACGYLYANEETYTQVLIGMVKNSPPMAKQLLFEILDNIYADEQQKSLRPVNEIIQLFKKPEPQQEEEPEFIYHRNAPAPTLIFRKEDYGAFSPVFQASFKRKGGRSLRDPLQLSTGSDTQASPESDKQAVVQSAMTNQPHQLIFNFVLGISQPFLEECLFWIERFIDKYKGQHQFHISIPGLTNFNIDVLRFRCNSAQKLMEENFLQVAASQEADDAAMEQLIERIEVEEQFEIVVKRIQRQQFCQLLDGKTLVYSCFALDKFMFIMNEPKVVQQLEGSFSLQKLAAGIQEATEKLNEGALPVRPPQVVFTQDGVIFRGGLYPFINIKENQSVNNLTFVVFTQVQTIEQQKRLSKLQEVAEKAPAMFCFFVDKVFTQQDCASRKGLNNKTVAAPIKNLFSELKKELNARGGTMVISTDGEIVPQEDELLEKAVEKRVAEIYQAIRQAQQQQQIQEENNEDKTETEQVVEQQPQQPQQNAEEQK